MKDDFTKKTKKIQTYSIILKKERGDVIDI